LSDHIPSSLSERASFARCGDHGAMMWSHERRAGSARASAARPPSAAALIKGLGNRGCVYAVHRAARSPSLLAFVFVVGATLGSSMLHPLLGEAHARRHGIWYAVTCEINAKLLVAELENLEQFATADAEYSTGKQRWRFVAAYNVTVAIGEGCDPAAPAPPRSARHSEAELRRIFYAYGEEKLAPRYARRIVERRSERPLTRSSELVQLIIDATPRAVQRSGHPAKRVFQALRIEVNRELAAPETALPAALDALAFGGRIVVLAYQSLEDRIVKRELAARSRSTAPEGLPVELPEHRPEFRLLVRGAELADEAERESNSRSVPVRLRAAERVREAV